jgi:deazaflavin-dependent oxidoreductase (nitroreductase family)
MTTTRQPARQDKLPPLIPRVLNRWTSPHSAPAATLRFHRWVYTRSNGRIGPGMIGAWTLLLLTTGRRTGARRTSALVFARDGGRVILAASNDGKDQPPAWFLNLCADPQVELQIGRDHLPGTAAVIESPIRTTGGCGS